MILQAVSPARLVISLSMAVVFTIVTVMASELVYLALSFTQQVTFLGRIKQKLSKVYFIDS